jgi:hypothetical protein
MKPPFAIPTLVQRSMWRITWIVFLALLAGACTHIQSNITVFHDLDAGIAGTTYKMVPFKDQVGSLEHRTYEQIVKQELNARGFVEVPIQQAAVVVFMSYGIDVGKQVVTSYPIIGQTGVSSSQTYGTVQNYGGYGTYSGSKIYTPTYGVVGTGVGSRTDYTRFLNLEIIDKTTISEQRIDRRYEARVISIGTSSQMVAVLPSMIKALFEDFPGQSGSTRSVKRYSD